MSFLREKGANHRQRPMVANWTLGGMSPEQNVAHIALIHTDQPSPLHRGECDSYAFGFVLPYSLFADVA